MCVCTLALPYPNVIYSTSHAAATRPTHGRVPQCSIYISTCAHMWAYILAAHGLAAMRCRHFLLCAWARRSQAIQMHRLIMHNLMMWSGCTHAWMWETRGNSRAICKQSVVGGGGERAIMQCSVCVCVRMLHVIWTMPAMPTMTTHIRALHCNWARARAPSSACMQMC